MRSLISALLAALMLSFAVPAYAQPAYSPETYERYRLPAGVRCIGLPGIPHQCFALSEYVVLLEMDVDLRFYDQAYPIAQEQIATLGNVAMQLNLAVDAATEQIEDLSRERSRLLEQWTEENRLRLEAENRPALGSTVAWVLATSFAIVAAILGGVLAGVSL